MTNKKGTRSYQCNFQVKRKRRREGKTDYKHRTNMLRQDQSKFGVVKSRMVVRITNQKVICAIHKANLEGDKVVAYADSTELKNYGINFGLKNYFAAYATGMLLGRRALKLNEMDSEYKSLDLAEIGEYKVVEEEEDKRYPYKVFLDIGLSRASKGAKVFAALKGASDSGLYIPHKPNKFYGFKDGQLNSEELRDRIFMKENIDYMKKLMETSEELYKKQFGEYKKLNINPDNIKSLYENCLKKINESPDKIKKEKKNYSSFKKYKVPKLTLEQRKSRAKKKLEAI